MSIRQNGGHLVYALDDAYIHMAMAKNFSKQGVWGVTKYEFSSSSSSILWTLILSAVYFVFGTNEIAPLLMNIAASTALMAFAYHTADRRRLPRIFTLFLLLGLILLTPLTALVLSRMEHTVQVLLAIAFTSLAARALSTQSPSVGLLAVTFFMTVTRFDGIFLVSVAWLLFILRRRWLYGCSLAAVGALPLVAYGALSLAHGWFFLPNSVLLKGNMPNLDSIDGAIKFVTRGPTQFLMVPAILVLIVFALAVYIDRLRKGFGPWEEHQVIITLFVATTLLHFQLASVGWLFRNEATVAANAIDAISYLTDIRTLDLWGLPTVEAAQHKRNRSYNKATAYELTKSKGAKIAIVYDRLFTDGNIVYDGIPEQWIKVGQWRIENNVVCGDDTVSFFALDPSEEGTLIANLKRFSPRLPRTRQTERQYIAGR